MGLIPSKKAKKNKTKRRNDGDITDGVHKTEKVRLKAMQQGTISKVWYLNEVYHIYIYISAIYSDMNSFLLAHPQVKGGMCNHLFFNFKFEEIKQVQKKEKKYK